MIMTNEQEIDMEFSRFMNPPETEEFFIEEQESEPNYDRVTAAIKDVPKQCWPEILKVLNAILQEDTDQNRSWLTSFAAGFLQPDGDSNLLRRYINNQLSQIHDETQLTKIFSFIHGLTGLE